MNMTLFPNQMRRLIPFISADLFYLGMQGIERKIHVTFHLLNAGFEIKNNIKNNI